MSEIQQIVPEYVQRVQDIPNVPSLSYGRGLLRDDGGPNRLFFTFLFCDKALAIRSLQDVKLIRSKVLCDTCRHFMMCCAEPSCSEGFVGEFTRGVLVSGVIGPCLSGTDPGFSRVILLSSKHYFSRTASSASNKRTKSKVNIASVPTHSLTGACSAGKSCWRTWSAALLKSVVLVEIDESKFGPRKYHKGHPVKGQWVFGGVERESGEIFLVPVMDRTADTLLAVIRDWIEPGTTVISDCWGAYHNLGSQGYQHRTVNHSINFRDPVTGDHTNTTESTWHIVKVFLGQYNRGEDYVYHLAHYLFAARCKAQGIPHFLLFLYFVANTDWSLCRLPSSAGRAT